MTMDDTNEGKIAKAKPGEHAIAANAAHAMLSESLSENSLAGKMLAEKPLSTNTILAKLEAGTDRATNNQANNDSAKNDKLCKVDSTTPPLSLEPLLAARSSQDSQVAATNSSTSDSTRQANSGDSTPALGSGRVHLMAYLKSHSSDNQPAVQDAVTSTPQRSSAPSDNAAATAGSANSGTLLEQLSSGNFKLGPCTVDEAKANNSYNLQPLQLSPDQTPKAQQPAQATDAGSSGNTAAAAPSGDSQPYGRARLGAYLRAHSDDNNAPAQNTSNGGPIANYDGSGKQAGTGDSKQALDTSSYRSNVYQSNFNGSDNNKAASAGYGGGSTAGGGSLLDQLKDGNYKTGACTTDEAKANGSYPTGPVKFNTGNTDSNSKPATDYSSTFRGGADNGTKSTDNVSGTRFQASGDGKAPADFGGTPVSGANRNSDTSTASRDTSTGRVQDFSAAPGGNRPEIGSRGDVVATGKSDIGGGARAENVATRTSDFVGKTDTFRNDPVVGVRETAADAGHKTISFDPPSEQHAKSVADCNPIIVAPAAHDATTQHSAANDNDGAGRRGGDAPVMVSAVAPAVIADRAVTAQNRFDMPTISLARTSLSGADSDLFTAKTISLSQADKGISLVLGADRAVSLSLQGNIVGLTGDRTAIPGQIITDRTSAAILAGDRAVSLTTQASIASMTQTQLGDRSAALTQGGDKVGGLAQPGGERIAGLTQTTGLTGAQDRVGSAVIDAGSRTASTVMDLSGAGRRDGGLTIATAGDRSTQILGDAGQKSAALIDNGGKAHADSQLTGLKTAELGAKLGGEKSNLIVDPLTGIVRNSTAAEAAAAAGKRGDILDERGITSRGYGDKLYFTGVEVAIAAILTMSGAARMRHDDQATAINNGNLPLDINGDPLDKSSGAADTSTSTKLCRRTHLVSHGDTLQSIADDLYQNQAIAWLIADMNATNIKDEWIDGKRVVELKSRQVIELPEPDEAIQFLARLRKDFEPDQLVTVVSESTVDRELLNTFLGTVSGAPATSIATASNTTTIAHPTAFPVAARQSTPLPNLTIDMDRHEEEELPIAESITNMVRNLSHKVGRLVKRPAGKLGTVVGS